MTSRGNAVKDRISRYKTEMDRLYSPGNVRLRAEVWRRALARGGGQPAVLGFARALVSFLDEKQIITTLNDTFAGQSQYYDFSTSHPGWSENGIAPLTYPFFCFDKQREVDQTLEVVGQTGEVEEVFRTFLAGCRCGLYDRWGMSHVIPGYQRLLSLGLGGIESRARAALAADPDNRTARAAVMIYPAFRRYILRYAERFDEMAWQAADPAEAVRLAAIAADCRSVSEGPPTTFAQAVQLLWLGHEVQTMELLSGSISPGRLDQILYPFYRDDLAAGRLDRDGAVELIQALWLKLALLRQGYQNVTLGGTDDQGRSAVNELSHLCIQAMMALRLDQPLLSVRWTEDMPHDFRQLVVELIRAGLGFPAVFNDPMAVRAKERAGVDAADAAGLGIVGCVEMAVPGREYGNTEELRLNWAKVLELMMGGGRCMLTGERVGLKPGPPPDGPADFSAFVDWYKQELAGFTDVAVEATNLLELGGAAKWPAPFLSSLMDGCLETGRDVTGGGTVYNLSSINGCGMADTVDSLTAVGRVVYTDRVTGLAGLRAALKADFQGHEPLLRRLKACPRVGNDLPGPDSLLAELCHHFADSINGRSNLRGGRYQTGLYSVTAHGYLGEMTAALPSGRRARLALANALSPCQGADTTSPTAVIKSLTGIDHSRLGNGMVLDLKFHPGFLDTAAHRRAFVHLIETYFKLGGLEIQFNLIDRATLLRARRHPDDYRDLVVRVSGFSAHFVSLDPALQEEIIARTEYGAA